MKNANLEKNAKSILREKGLKATAPRVMILALLQEFSEPFTTEDIYKKISKNMDLATTYRALQKFTEKGLVYQTDFRDGKAYYEYQKIHHHHAVCTTCGRREEVREICVETKSAAKSLEYFDTLNSHVLELFGVCKKCMKNT